jgi:DNA invertase Pin-like site-specific DNA recombinase
MKIGYARVSTDGQTLDHQQSALRDAGCDQVFAEKVSGAKSDRQQLTSAIAALGQGDTLIVCKLDRLARSTRDLLNTLAAIAAAGATFKSLGDPLGRHNHSAWSPYADCAGRVCRVRAPSDPGQDKRGQTTGAATWSEVRKKT